MSPEEAARDASGTRSCSAFLVEVAEKVPAAILPNLSLIISHLDDDVGISVQTFILSRIEN